MSDPVDFGRLVELHRHRLFSLCLILLRDESGAEEVAQDAFMRAYRNLDKFDDSRPFYPWLAAIAVRLAQTWLRRRQVRTAREQTDAGAAERAETPEPLTVDQLTDDERNTRLWAAVDALPQGQRLAVYLYYRQDLKLAETALAMSVTAGTVKTLLFRARKTLRRSMGETPHGDTEQDP